MTAQQARGQRFGSFRGHIPSEADRAAAVDARAETARGGGAYQVTWVLRAT